jgi:4-hydroxybenzoate polyprenyltransferase
MSATPPHVHREATATAAVPAAVPAPSGPLPGPRRIDPAQPPLVVDLDGTLIHSDLLWETLLLFARQQFWRLWLLPLWLFKGKAGFKLRLAAQVALDPATLPYDQTLLQQISHARDGGRRIVLATGAARPLADAVAAHVGLFDEVLASEDGVNLTSRHKAAALCRLYGERGFDYVGNGRADLAVWALSRHAYAVTRAPLRLADGRLTEAMGEARAALAPALLQSMRPRQWLKNLLVFVPMLAAHALGAATFMQSLAAFVGFSLCASSAYLLNDALDAADDRLHPLKRRRPIAAGRLPLSVALPASALLALAALAWCASQDRLLALVTLVYFGCTLAYSLLLKRLVMLDIVALAILYTLRILGGSAATAIVPSFWLLAFSFFIFLSLALLKRYSELFNLMRRGKDKSSGRGYTTADKTPIGVMGINSAFLSVLIFMLYFNSQTVLTMYRHPYFLLGIVPLLVFWLGRLWILASRGQVNEDPVLYVSKDRVSLAVLALCLLLALAATY